MKIFICVYICNKIVLSFNFQEMADFGDGTVRLGMRSYKYFATNKKKLIRTALITATASESTSLCHQ